jgi:hypothetical protein
MLGEEQDQIDIGGEVELASAELAHTDYDQWLNNARLRTRLPIAGNELTPRKVAGCVNRCVSECCEIGEGFFQVCPAGEVAPCNAHHLATAPFP